MSIACSCERCRGACVRSVYISSAEATATYRAAVGVPLWVCCYQTIMSSAMDASSKCAAGAVRQEAFVLVELPRKYALLGRFAKRVPPPRYSAPRARSVPHLAL